MATRMTHPQHGATHAYDNGEVARLEKSGWTVEQPAKPAVVEVPPLEQPAAPQKQKPGPKPKVK